jgi:alkylmercury lyase
MTQRTFTHAELEQMAEATTSAAAAIAAPGPDPLAEARKWGGAFRALLSALADGRPAAISELARAAGQTSEETEAALRAISDVEWDAEGRVTGFGMTLNPTPHQVETGGHRLYGWCVPDVLGGLPAIGRTVTITSRCPATGQTVTATAGPDGVRDVHPPQAVVSAVVTGDPEADGLRASLCNLADFFASEQAAAGWAAEHPDGVLLTVPEAYHYARSIMRLSLGD